MRRTRGSSGGTYAERGNEFHYRWVAQRLLQLLRSASRLESVTVEGDIAPKDGDESLDAVEYYTDGTKRHIQLKHSTAKRNITANLSEYTKTIKDFAEIFSNEDSANKVIFTIVTNRQWSASANKKLQSLADGGTLDDKLWMDVAKVLNTEQGSVLFRDFCSRLELIGGEPDLQEQMSGLKRTLSEHLPTLADTNRANQIVQIVRDRAIEVGDEREPIRRRDVLATFGVVCEEDVFPAPQLYDEENDYIDNQNLKELRSAIDESKDHWLIHGGAGSGKTVTMRRLASEIASPSVAVLFDCFGGGSYRSPMRQRYRVKDALIQINNELAANDLCPFLFANSTSEDVFYARTFHRNLKTAIKRVRQKSSAGCIYILVDAADNAEMAASEAGGTSWCFVDYLRDTLGFEHIDGVHFVFSARTERRNLLEKNGVFSNERVVSPFSVDETRELVRRRVCDIDEGLAKRIRAYTQGVPRVIANLIHGARNSKDIADRVGDNASKDVLTVEAILENKYSAIEEKLRRNYGSKDVAAINRLSSLLAILPPDIPIEVLARGIGTTDGFVNDFLVDFDYPIWRDKNCVRFHDEPTETWFRQKYGQDARKTFLRDVISSVSSLASKSLYVSRCLPHLYMMDHDYQGLVAYVKNDANIPADLNPEAMRRIKLERYVFAMRAFLATSNFKEAMFCAFNASQLFLDSKAVNSFIREHVALFANTCNVDELAAIDLVTDGEDLWKGAKGIYRALLLSYVDDKVEEAAGMADVIIRQIENSDKIMKNRRSVGDQGDYGEERVGFNERAAMALLLARVKGVTACAKFLSKSEITEQNRRYVSQLLAILLVEVNEYNLIQKLAKSTSSYPDVAMPLIASLYDMKVPVERGLVEEVIGAIKEQQRSNTLSLQGEAWGGSRDVVVFCLLAKTLGFDSSDLAQILCRYYIDVGAFDAYTRPWEKHANDLFFEAIALLNVLDGRGKSVEWFIQHVKLQAPMIGEEKVLELRFLYDGSVRAAGRRVKEYLSTTISEGSHAKLQNEVLKRANETASEEQTNGNFQKSAEAYIRAAGATTDQRDAKAYVKRAIEQIKASDILASWEVIQRVANKAISEKLDPSVVYKFIRLGEKVHHDDTKHFNRMEFLKSVGQFSGASSIALLSRWRDRDVVKIETEFPYFARDAKVLDLKSFPKGVLSGIGGVAPSRHSSTEYVHYKTVPEKAAEQYYSSVSSNDAVGTIESWSTDPAVEPKDVLARFEYMPKEWKEKPSVNDAWDSLLDRMSGKMAAHGVDYLAGEWVVLLSKISSSHEELTRNLYRKAALCENWNAQTCNWLIMCGQSLVSDKEARDLLQDAVQIIEKGKGTAESDGEFSKKFFPDVTSMEAFARMIYAMLGAADSADRWRAAHVVRDMVLARVAEFVDCLCKVVEDEDVTGYVGRGLPFYEYTAKTFFLIAIFRAAQIDNSACSKFVKVVKSILSGANHVQHIWFAEAFLRCMGELKGPPTLSWDSEGVADGVSIKRAVSRKSRERFRFLDGFESSEIQCLAEVFGLPADNVRSLVLDVIEQIQKMPCDGDSNNDVRVVSHDDWDYSQLCKLHGEHMPYISTYGYDLSYNALMIVAKSLYDRCRVLSNVECRGKWDIWLKRHLLTRQDDKWLSDCCGHVDEIDEKYLLSLIKECEPRYIPINFAEKNYALLGGYFYLYETDGRWLCVISSSFEGAKGEKIKCLRPADWNFQGIDSIDPMAGAVVYESYVPVFACADADYAERYFSSHREAFKSLRGCTVSGYYSLLSLSRMAEVCEEMRGRFVIKVELHHMVYRQKEEDPQCDELVLDRKEIEKIRQK